MTRAGLAGAILALVLATVAPAGAGSRLDPDVALQASAGAIGRTLGDYRLLDGSGDGVQLVAFRGKPLVINLAYTGCTQSCPLVVQSLYDAVDAAHDVFGPDSFRVVTIGFDSAQDTPARMRAYARSQGVDLPGWRFLAADANTIAALADELGFSLVPSPAGFDHLAQTTVIDGEGRIYSHIYGSDFAPPALVEPLKALRGGEALAAVSFDGLIERVRLFCTIYNASTGRYRFDYSIFIALTIGGLSLAGLAVIIGRTLMRERPSA